MNRNTAIEMLDKNRFLLKIALFVGLMFLAFAATFWDQKLEWEFALASLAYGGICMTCGVLSMRNFNRFLVALDGPIPSSRWMTGFSSPRRRLRGTLPLESDEEMEED